MGSYMFYTIVIFAMVTLSFAQRIDTNYVEVYDIDSKRNTPVEQLPPLDPAVHSFPTVPTVPLVPTCVKQGYFRDPFNCGKFYYCKFSDAVPLAFYCQTGFIFNTITDSCDHPHLVEC